MLTILFCIFVKQWRSKTMARYKLTKTAESEGDKHFYSIECLDEWKFILVSWDYKKLEEIVSKLNVGEEYIINL